MIQDFLIKLIVALLTTLFKGAVAEAKKHADQIDLEKNREEVNAANVAKYEAAQSRADRIKAALDVLNRTPSV